MEQAEQVVAMFAELTWWEVALGVVVGLTLWKVIPVILFVILLIVLVLISAVVKYNKKKEKARLSK